VNTALTTEERVTMANNKTNVHVLHGKVGMCGTQLIYVVRNFREVTMNSWVVFNNLFHCNESSGELLTQSLSAVRNKLKARVLRYVLVLVCSKKSCPRTFSRVQVGECREEN
jgi:hypothetical protein